MKTRINIFIFFLIYALLAIGVTLPASPLFFPIPDRDSGVFLYTANKILEGGLPYKDVWDHKPPAIYYINALGLLIGNGSSWGVWLLEYIAIFISLIIGFQILSNAFGKLPAFTSLFILITQLSTLIEDGNYTEIFAFPIQFLIIYLYLEISTSNSKWIKWLLFGILGSFLFLLRQNLIGIWTSCLIVLFLKGVKNSNKQFIKYLSIIFTSSILVIFFVVFYFYVNHILSDFWEASFVYNFYYSKTAPGIKPRICAFITGIKITWETGLFLFGLIGYIISIFIIINHRIQQTNVRLLLNLFLINLPIEILLTSITGRQPPHYYISWLPSLVFFSTFFIKTLMAYKNDQIRKYSNQINFLIPIFIFLVFNLSGINLIFKNFPPSNHMQIYYAQHKVIADYVINHSKDSNYVLLWGAETTINFYTKRPSPTRFVYQYPLFTKGYATTSMINEFFQDIKIYKPSLIIDAWNGTDKIPPINSYTRKKWSSRWSETYVMHPEMEKVTDYIETNYEIIDKLGPQQWVVYSLKSKIQ